MKKILLFIFLLMNCSIVFALPHGGVYSILALSPSDTTIQGTWNTSGSGNTVFACGTTLGTYNINAVDNPYQSSISVNSHVGIVAGLTASTLYYCQGTSTISGTPHYVTGIVTTNSARTSTALISVTWGTPAVAVNNQNTGDTYYNAVGSNGTTYVGTDDSSNPWGGSGTSNMMIGKFTSTSPFTGDQVNAFSNYGTWATCPSPDNRTPKEYGIFAYDNNLYLSYSRLIGGECPNYTSNTGFGFDAQIFSSTDFGVTWCGFQGNCSTNGPLATPATASMFPSVTDATFTANASGQNMTVTNISGTINIGDQLSGTNINSQSVVTSQTSGTTGGNGVYIIDHTSTASNVSGTSTNQACGIVNFVMYGSDNGNVLPAYRVDNSDAYVYLVCAVGGGAYQTSNLALARMPLSSLPTLDTTYIQYYTGGNGLLASAWTTTYSPSTQAIILNNPGKINTPSIQYMPSTGRYILMTVYNATPGVSSNSTWLTYEAPHPWGPWTLIDTTYWGTGGWYLQTIWVPSAATATANGNPMTVLMAGDYSNPTYYQLWTVTGVFNTH